MEAFSKYSLMKVSSSGEEALNGGIVGLTTLFHGFGATNKTTVLIVAIESYFQVQAKQKIKDWIIKSLVFFIKDLEMKLEAKNIQCEME